MFFYGRIVISFHSLSSKSRNSKVFTNSHFKMALSFAIVCSIAAPAPKFINMPGSKKTGTLSLPVMEFNDRSRGVNISLHDYS